MASEFDVIVYGATGYTGRLVAEYIAGAEMCDHLVTASHHPEGSIDDHAHAAVVAGLTLDDQRIPRGVVDL